MDINNSLKLSLEELGVGHTHNQINALKVYLEILYEYNKKINLTGTKSKEDILKRHILDSLSLLKYRSEILKDNCRKQKILDLGTGAGLPGIPLSIFLSERMFYLIEASLKKINFLNTAVKELNLGNVRIIRGRAEELGREKYYREDFDIVLARAVAKTNILSELAIPFCKISGKIIFYKSRKINIDIKESGEPILKLGGAIDKLLEVRVPYLNEYRVFLVISKVKKSPDTYPRSFNKIKKNPM